MSHPTTTTDFDKYATFKITTTNTLKRTSNESHDESKKLRLEKSGSSGNIILATTNTTASVNAIQAAAANNVVISSTADVTTKKLKTRKIVSDGTTTQQYQLIVEDSSASAGAFSEESCGGGETSTKMYSTSAEEMVLIRKQVSAKSAANDGNDVGVEERIIHIEGDPGTAGTAYLTAMNAKSAPKRLQIGMAEAKKSLGDSIDLKLITTTGDAAQTTGKFSMMSASASGEKKPEQQILLAASSSSINPQNTFTYSRVCSVSNVTGPGGESVNLKNLQGTVKNPSLVVSSKKLLPEVTQATAKVSIGNTTISVPLLKPLNSSQIIQAGGNSSSQSGQSDGTKSVIHTIQTSSSQSPQTQLSKILNIKRGQKMSQPTFVSLSQLQIKPVSSAKIVQAKVVSKKIPLHIQAVQTNKTTLLQQTSGVVTITSTKPELQGQQLQQQTTLQGHILPSPQKKQQQLSFVKDLPVGAIIKTSSSNTNAEEFISSSQVPATSSSSTTSDQPTIISSTTLVNADKGQLVKTSSVGGSSGDSSGPSIIATEFLPAGVKVVHTSTGATHLNSANIRPSLTSQHDSMDQSPSQPPQTTQRINICPTISIVRQNSPQLVTTSGNLSTVSLSMADAVSGQQKLILTKSQFANVSSANISSSGANTVTTNFPRNISLMLAKTSSGQQVFTNAGAKTTLCVTTSANNPNKTNAPARMNLSINPNVMSSTSATGGSMNVVTAGAQNEGETGTAVEGSCGATQETVNASQQPQQQAQATQQIQTNVVQNRKIIQVLPGGLYSSSGGSFVQITKAKPDPEEEKKKIGELEQQQHVHQQIQHIQHQQQQQIHLQIQQSPTPQQSAQQHQIQLQIQQQQQQQQHQSHQQIQIQQIQTQQVAQSQQQRQQQLIQQQRQLLHKQQIQQQLHKQQQQQQHMLQQQQSQNHEPTSTESTQSQSPFTTSTTITPPSTVDNPLQQQHLHHMSAPHPPKNEESNNVLLKQLLQNSNSAPINSQTSNQNARAPTAVLPARKVINVRAPSLGLVSSLEAQLARPVIPPVPASESNAHSTTPSTPPTTAPTPQSQTHKMSMDNTKASSALPVYSSAPTTPHSTSSATTPTSAPSLIISSSKTLSQTSDKPKFASSPLISKETSFVSKATLPEQTEQNIEIFSLQSSSGDSAAKSEHQQQSQQQHFDHLPSPTLGQQQVQQQQHQILNHSFKAFTHNASQGSITTKITKFVQDAKKANEHHHHHQQQHHQLQHQQQQLSVTRTYSSASSNVVSNIANSKEKNSGNISINAHSNSHTGATALSVSSNVSQQHPQLLTGMQQQNKIFGTQMDGHLSDKSNQTKAIEGQTSTAVHMPQSLNQVIVQQQHIQQQDPSKAGGMVSVKMEPDDPNTLQQLLLHQQHQSQMQHHQQPQQQQSIRHHTTPSPMSTTPTHSVATTPTIECQPPVNIINKQQIILQHQTQQQSNNPPSAPNSASKDGDNRKKRKRANEPQKQRKQIATNTKETAAANSSTASSASAASAVNNKKRSRKSLKLEEDYDSFIDNLMLHLRQMPPMQVLEPQLNVNYGVCNMYGWRNCTSSNNSTNSQQKESRQSERGNLFEQELEGEFGSGYIPNKVPFYDLKKFRGRKTNDDANASSSIQNNYYDQEFTSFTYKSEPDKLNSWVKVYRERAVDTPEIVSNKLLMPIDPVKTMRLNMLQQETFPGLILMSSTQQRLGRMSPVIPVVNSMALITKRKKTPLKPLENDADNGLYIKELPEDIDYKGGMKNNVNSQNVILSLPTSSAERLLDVLKNLANLLQINTPIPYKVVDEVESELDDKSLSPSASDRELALKHFPILDILNGRSKMCRQCGKAIKGRCLKNNNDNTKTAQHIKLLHPSQPRYFCNKVCFLQFRLSTDKKPLSASALQSVLASSEGATNESELMEDLLDIKPDITTLLTEKNEVDMVAVQETSVEPVAKTKKVCFRYFNSKCFQPTTPVKRMSEKEIRDMLFKMDITMSASTPQVSSIEPGGHLMPIEDRRTCVLCSQIGDGVADGPSRLLNYDVDKWVHLNCALWSSDVYETISGGLMHFQMALHIGLNQTCNTCQQLGATVKCYKTRCGAVFHLPCAIRDQCVFYQNKTIHCHAHASRNDKDKELLTLSVPRRVFVERDENRQVAAIMHHSEMVNLLRVGSLIFMNVGQLLPHQLDAFHTPNYIYPIGYKIIRFFWSMRRPNKRCRYVCSIAEVAGRPEFRIVVQDPGEADVELRDVSPKAVWQRVLQSVAEMRRSHNLVKLYPEFISGEDLFGLTEPAIVRIIESLPGVETLTNYRFKYGRNPLLDLPLALNPSGAARTEPKLRQLMGWKKHHPQRTCSTVTSLGGHQAALPSVAAAGEVTCPYSKQFVHSKSSQYKKMKQEWRNNVYLARSKIAGLGLYAARDMEKHTMIIEYIGEVIRSEVSEIREKQYEARNRGIYMFRLDEDRVVDATLCGGLARYINHSCNPNCVTEIVEVDRELRIIIFAKRRINRSEELSYDYKFDIEDDGSKIPCMCGAPNCRKWMN